MEILIYHTRQTGDVIMGAHCAKLVKKKYPDSTIMFVTQPLLVPLISPCEWIDITLSRPDYIVREIFSKEDIESPKLQWQYFDLIDLRTFERLRDDFKPALASYIRWDPTKKTIPYKAPYMFRCYANCCELTQEEADDTRYSLPLDEEEIDKGNKFWNRQNSSERILLHMDTLKPEFESLTKSIGAVLLDTSGKVTWRQNLAIIGTADFVVTRYGGVAVMAAAVGTRTIMIPKPEPTTWASPIYSHPNEGHTLLLPGKHCDKFDSDVERQLQPCQLAYAEYDQTLCPLGLTNHCWNQITPQDVEDFFWYNVWEEAIL